MSAKAIFAGGFLALAALVAGTSTAQAQFLPYGGGHHHYHGGISQTVIVSRPPIFTTVNSYGGFGTPLYSGAYFQPQPVYYAPTYGGGFGGGYGYGGGFGGGYGGFNPAWGGGFNPYHGGFGRPGVNVGFNFNFR